MILNSQTAQLIRDNALRLATSIRGKEDLADMATAGSFEQVFAAIETLLTNTDMFFDDELLASLDEQNWKSFKATLLVYTFNIVNRHIVSTRESHAGHFRQSFEGREFGVSAAQL
jgi:sulfatase maturation enzyme AslB (radical SAM superfamily)